MTRRFGLARAKQHKAPPAVRMKKKTPVDRSGPSDPIPVHDPTFQPASGRTYFVLFGRRLMHTVCWRQHLPMLDIRQEMGFAWKRRKRKCTLSGLNLVFCTRRACRRLSSKMTPRSHGLSRCEYALTHTRGVLLRHAIPFERGTVRQTDPSYRERFSRVKISKNPPHRAIHHNHCHSSPHEAIHAGLRTKTRRTSTFTAGRNRSTTSRPRSPPAHEAAIPLQTPANSHRSPHQMTENPPDACVRTYERRESPAEKNGQR